MPDTPLFTTALEERLRAVPAASRRRRVARVAVVVAATVAAVPTVAALTGQDAAERTAVARGIAIDGEAPVRVLGRVDPGVLAKLQASLAQRGVELRVEERPAKPADEGLVLSLVVSARDAVGPDGLLDPAKLHRGDEPVVIMVGRSRLGGSETAATSWRSDARLCGLIDTGDARGTAAALLRAGYAPTWVLLVRAGEIRPIDAPPRGSVITGVEGDARRPGFEVATPDAAQAIGHPGGLDPGCAGGG